jgi:hypothetical protein
MHATRHALEQAKTRFKWNRKTTERMADVTIARGVEVRRPDPNARAFQHGETVWVFDPGLTVLVTLFRCKHEHVRKGEFD